MHSIESYLKRQRTEVLEVLLLQHQEGTAMLQENIAQYIEELLQERANGSASGPAAAHPKPAADTR